jgi:hypothetical protein
MWALAPEVRASSQCLDLPFVPRVEWQNLTRQDLASHVSMHSGLPHGGQLPANVWHERNSLSRSFSSRIRLELHSPQPVFLRWSIGSRPIVRDADFATKPPNPRRRPINYPGKLGPIITLTSLP